MGEQGLGDVLGEQGGYKSGLEKSGGSKKLPANESAASKGFLRHPVRTFRVTAPSIDKEDLRPTIYSSWVTI